MYFVQPHKEIHAGPDTYVARIRAAASKAGLLLELMERLALPDYFGFNWDALDECLGDFHWIGERLIVMVHEPLHPALPDEDLAVYLAVLRDAVNGWKMDEDHELWVAFDESDRDRITALGSVT
jgi:hypothetical protein